ncbi:MAG: histidine--tRNA ligase [Candidatus Moranbacteria bacterium RIFOXYA2_FULL_43_15]|nr:MAG: histidine--tRNA ligase [Candidatus Moranbacteria bacterium RIFOXYA2_FULL_43_15]
MKNNISNLPPIGTADWTGDEFIIRKFIFDTWREVCERYGYKEYLTPILEKAEIYRAKSGEDIGGKELLVFRGRAGRELSIRPEMTPSVTRLVSRIFNESPKPLKLFSIANFFHNERPQRGRNREFWQLNFDVFGSESIWADIEILQVALDIMLAFNPPKNSFTLLLNSRKIIEAFMKEVLQIDPAVNLKFARILDKKEKLSLKEFEDNLKNIGIDTEQIKKINLFMDSNDLEELTTAIPALSENEGVKEINNIIESLEKMGYGQWVKFKPGVIRGFDYYDGMIFEVFDNNPKNNRSMFGGGRYNGLAGIFGVNAFPAVGSAPGDETMKLFLEEWDLIDKILKNTKPETYYFPILNESSYFNVQEIAKVLRKANKRVGVGMKVQKLNKALDYANQKKISRVIILDENEKDQGVYKIKDMETGEEKSVTF